MTITRTLTRSITRALTRPITQAGAGGGFELESLWANGEQAAYFDLSDMSTIFQDVARTVPVTTNGQPIAAVFDKSGHGLHWQRLSTDAQRPAWDDSGALVTDGVNNWLYTQMPWTDAWTIVAVLQSQAAGATSGALFGRGSFNHMKDASGGLVAWGGNSANATVTFPDTADIRTRACVVTTVRHSDASQTFRFNGQPLGSGIIPNTNDQLWLTIGAQDGFGASKLATKCWQFFVINRALSATEVVNAERTLIAAASAPAVVPMSGYDVFVVAGQSNTYYGTPLDAGLDTVDANVFEYTQYGTIRQANDPLDTFVGRTAGYIGFAMPFAKAYVAANPGRKVLLVHCGYGGTGFSTASPNTWASGVGSLRERTITRANAALAYGNTLKGILWHQGESDELAHATHAASLDGLIADFRAGITGASSVPFVAGGLGEAWVGVDVERQAVQAAIAGVPSRNSAAGYADSASLALSDGLHFSAAAQRTFGGRYYTAYLAALSDA